MLFDSFPGSKFYYGPRKEKNQLTGIGHFGSIDQTGFNLQKTPVKVAPGFCQPTLLLLQETGFQGIVTNGNQGNL